MEEIEIPKWAIALVGVTAGFILKELSDLIKEKLRSRKYRSALEDEIKTNLHQLEQKKDIAVQMKEALSKGRFLSGLSVPFASSVYDHYFPSILKDLNSLQRDNIRHIYSTLKVLDDFMSGMEKSYKEDAQGTAMGDVNSAYLGKIDDVLNTYGIVQNLINQYISSSPVDIYYREDKNT